MKTPILAAIRCSLVFTAITASLFSVQPAQAFTITLEQMGANVVATGSGAINLTGLTFGGIYGAGVGMSPDLGGIFTGEQGQSIDTYAGFMGPTSFGSGGRTRH